MKNLLMELALLKFPHRNWDIIKAQCKGKSGVYGFINNINGNCYIGSAVNLYDRLRDYHQLWYLSSRYSTLIVRAINKYGMDNFTIVILEFTSPEQVVAAEQVWINNYAPEYNILSTAASSLGYKHTEEDKEKISEAMTGKPRSQEVREDMSKRQQGSGNTFFGKTHTEDAKAQLRAHALSRTKDPNPGFPITVLDTETGLSVSYKSLRAAGRALGCSHGHLAKFHNRHYANRYLITINKSP